MHLIHPWILNYRYIIPHQKRRNKTELETNKRPSRPFSEKSRHCLKNVQSQMHFCKKKQTNPPFEDQSHNKILIKRRDFYSATVFRNLKRAFNGVEAIISKYFIYIFAKSL